MSGRRRSVVWDHFDKSVDKKYVQCNICKKELKFFGNTTNLTQHLKRVHPMYVSDTDRDIKTFLGNTITRSKARDIKQSKKTSIRLPPSNSKQNTTRREGKRSYVWRYFSKCDENHVECQICEKEFKFFGNTTNMSQHLERIHSSHIAGVDRKLNQTHNSVRQIIPKQETQIVDLLSPIEYNIDEQESPSQSPEQSPERSPVQSPVHSPSMNIKHPRQLRLYGSKIPKAELKDIDDILLEMIVVDLLPLSIVENPGFLKYSKKLQPLYNPPSREILASNLLPAKYNEVRIKLQCILNKIEFVSVTIEIWTSGSNNAFVTATAHYILDTKMYSPVLATKKLPESHTSENIALVLADLFEEFGIADKIVAIVSDNDLNVTNAVTEHLQKLHHQCVGQMLNLTVIDAIKENSTFSFILRKCRSLMFFFKNSAVATQSLTDIQQGLNLPILNVMLDIPTCWNSTLKMLKLLVQLTTPISAAIANLEGAPHILDENEWKVIHDCIPILDPLDEMTTALLSGENYPTLSIIIPLMTGIRHILERLKPTTKEGQLLQRSVIDSISKQLGILDQSKLAAKATFLDPRFKKAGFRNDSNANVVQEWVSQELTLKIKCLENENRINNVQGLKLEILEPYAQDTIWSLFDSQVAQKTASITPTMTSNLLLEQYLEMPYLERTKNPLKFWANHLLSLRELYSLHLKYLCVPATSIPSQQIFSKAGQTTDDRRNIFPSKYVDQIVFLNSAYKNNLI